MESVFFAGNRAQLLKRLKPRSAVVMSAFGQVQRDVDQPFAFQQEGNFWYLTGLEEADWRLVLDTDSGDEWLIAPSLSHYQLIFDGGLTPEQATAISGVKNILTWPEGKALLRKLLPAKKQVYCLVPKPRRLYGFQPNTAQSRLKTELKPFTLVDVRGALASLRAIKQPAEIAAIQSAVDVTVDGLLATLPQLKHYTHEYQVDAQLYQEFRGRGAVHAFDPIVASDAKACILHAAAANDPLGNWLLLDVGARVNGYAADITRTVPRTPPTDRQIQVYSAVEQMHDFFLSLLRHDAPVKQVLQQAYNFAGDQMKQLGLFESAKATQKEVFTFMPHGITHGLGVDVHDPLGRPEHFLANMVLTDEVGIYLPKEGFGVRIENDILITEHGAKNLAARLPTSLHTLAGMIY